MARSTVAQVVQIGRETTPGTPVNASKRLSSLSVGMSPEVEAESFRPRGSKFVTVVAPNKEWATGDLEGTPTYDEVVYPLAGALTAPVVTAVVGAAGAYEWVFEPSSDSADTPAVFTVEQGDDALAERSAHVLFTDFGMDFSRDEVTLSGSAIGRALERGRGLTPDVPAVASDLVPILPGQVCVYVSDDPDTLGTEATHVTNGLRLALSVGGRYTPIWFLNCQEDSFSTFVEAPEVDATAELTIEADTDGLAWADQFRTAATRFIRVEAKGPQIVAGQEASRYRLTWDLAVKVMDPGEQSDEDGLWAIQPELVMVHDAAWGRATRVTVVNTLSGL